jgi:hypothetical protein
MAVANIACSCGCSPCVCATPPIGLGCVADFCVPRPCFFNGQLVTADDLNAMMTYFRTKEAILAKLVAGWGVMGGMRLGSAGTPALHLLSTGNAATDALLAPLLPNPQIVAGPIIQVSAGAAIDNAGRILSLCAARNIDVLELSKGLGVPQRTGTCEDFFGDGFCELPILAEAGGTITGAAFWVVAEHVETPSRPVPQFAGGGACDPDPGCDFSRKLEEVRIRLVPDLPLLYFLHGCLEPVPVPFFDELIALLGVGGLEIDTAMVSSMASSMVTPEMLSTLSSQVTGFSGPTANDAMVQLFNCVGFRVIPSLFELLNRIALETCCSKPAVVLGRVVLATEVPEAIQDELGVHSHYVFIDDAFPYRRLVPNGAMNQTVILILIILILCAGLEGGGGE